jgi:membrane-bound lytic murein transglycosylase D
VRVPRFAATCTLAALALVSLSAGCAARQDLATAADVHDDADGPSGEPLAAQRSEGSAEGRPGEMRDPEVPEDPLAGDAAEAEASLEEPPSDAEVAEDSTHIVAEALEVCESARLFWEQGEVNEALGALDRAYELLLAIPEDDPDLAQQKSDLRHLISRQVVEIYGSRLTTAIDTRSPIPVETNAHVEREIASFQGPEREFFLEAYRRSGLYRPMIERLLEEAGLPKELSWLPLVESGFKTRALSRARAMGLWQFISSTGYRFGLGRSNWIDERMDPEKSTRAAIGYLTELHAMFGDWMSALAGYNCGEHRVAGVIRRQENGYLDHFWDLFEQLPRETARYVPRFLATLLIVGDPARYGFELPQPLPPAVWETVPVGRHLRLEDLDRQLRLEAGTMAALNPELRRGLTPNELYELKVPPDSASGFEEALAKLPTHVPPEETFVVHRVRRGETLSRIARHYGTSVSTLVRVNSLRSGNRIWPGQRLKVPKRGGASLPVASVAADGAALDLTHRVSAGDSLWKLASRYGTTVDRIKRDNRLGGDRLYVGQQLRISTGAPSNAATYAVRPGDTLDKIARANRVSLTAILRANGLSRSSTIYPGQVLVIPD